MFSEGQEKKVIKSQRSFTQSSSFFNYLNCKIKLEKKTNHLCYTQIKFPTTKIRGVNTNGLHTSYHERTRLDRNL